MDKYIAVYYEVNSGETRTLSVYATGIAEALEAVKQEITKLDSTEDDIHVVFKHSGDFVVQQDPGEFLFISDI